MTGTARFSGYRKLLALICVCVCATVAQALGAFDATLAAFLGSVYGAYVAGNFGEHWSRAKSPFPPLPHLIPRRGAAPAPPKQDDIVARLEAAGFNIDEVQHALEAQR